MQRQHLLGGGLELVAVAEVHVTKRRGRREVSKQPWGHLHPTLTPLLSCGA